MTYICDEHCGPGKCLRFDNLDCRNFCYISERFKDKYFTSERWYNRVQKEK